MEYFSFIAPIGIAMDKYEFELYSNGDSEKLTAIVAPDDATNKNVVWSSSDESIASVDQNGIVTGHKFGTATITATTEDGNFSALAEVKVKFWDSEVGLIDGSSGSKITANMSNAVNWMGEQGFTKGLNSELVEFGSFHSTSRKDFVIFLWRAAGKPSVAGMKALSFTDANGTTYNRNSDTYKAIQWAYNKGIIAGYSNGNGTYSFRPNDSVTRAQVCTMIWKYAGRPTVTGSIRNFPDVKVGSEGLTANMVKAIQWCSSKKIVNGFSDGIYAGTFQPSGNCIRCQMAIILKKYIDL